MSLGRFKKELAANSTHEAGECIAFPMHPLIAKTSIHTYVKVREYIEHIEQSGGSARPCQREPDAAADHKTAGDARQ
jgi:hypothetical protein